MTPGVIGFDWETTVARPLQREVCTVQVEHTDGRAEVAYIYNRFEDQKKLVAALNASPATLAAHSAIFELECMHKLRAHPKHVVCTMIAAKCIEMVQGDEKKDRISFSLAACCERHLGIKVEKEVRDRDWREPLDAKAIYYCLQDAKLPLKLWLRLNTIMPDYQREAFNTINDALPVLAECNLTGLRLDKEAHEALCKQLQAQVEVSLFELDLLSDCEIDNHRSAPQVSAWCVEQCTGVADMSGSTAAMWLNTIANEALGKPLIWPVTDSNGNLSMDKNAVGRVLFDMEALFPKVGAYLRARLQYNQARTLLQNFGPGMAKLLDADGRLRGQFKPHAARTSRMSCVGPNLQQMPAKTMPAFRKLFITPEGKVMVVADFGQIELRVGALLTGDQAMLQVFIDGEDLHAAMAMAIWGLNNFDFENAQHMLYRSKGKAVSFAALYGAMAPTIALNSGLSLEEAQAMLDSWLARFYKIKEYRETQFKVCMGRGYIELVSGRRIGVTANTSPPQTINCPVQGSSAEVMYKALTLYDRYLREASIREHVEICAPIHDEVISYVDPEHARVAADCKERAMGDALLYFFPAAAAMRMDQIAKASIVTSWFDAK